MLFGLYFPAPPSTTARLGSCKGSSSACYQIHACFDDYHQGQGPDLQVYYLETMCSPKPINLQMLEVAFSLLGLRAHFINRQAPSS